MPYVMYDELPSRNPDEIKPSKSSDDGIPIHRPIMPETPKTPHETFTRMIRVVADIKIKIRGSSKEEVDSAVESSPIIANEIGDVLADFIWEEADRDDESDLYVYAPICTTTTTKE